MIVGILLLAATGYSLKRGLPVGFIQACTAAISVLVSGTVLFFHPDPDCAFPVRRFEFGMMRSFYGL